MMERVQGGKASSKEQPSICESVTDLKLKLLLQTYEAYNRYMKYVTHVNHLSEQKTCVPEVLQNYKILCDKVILKSIIVSS